MQSNGRAFKDGELTVCVRSIVTRHLSFVTADNFFLRPFSFFLVTFFGRAERPAIAAIVSPTAKCVNLCLRHCALFPTIPSDLDVCGLLGFPSGELGPAVISRIGSKLEITMKTHPRSDSLPCGPNWVAKPDSVKS